MTRAPLDVTRGRPTSAAELNIARQLIARSGIVAALTPALDADVGRPRHLSLEGLLVGFQLNALRRHHEGHLVEVARVLNALTDEQRDALGIRGWDPAESYPRVDRLFIQLCRVLESKDSGFDAQWFANQLARAAIPKDELVSRSVAVDGTDIETWGVLRSKTVTIDLDGQATETQLMADGQSRPGGRPTSSSAQTARVVAIGTDGRKQYTADPDARAGHRSATGQRTAGPYVGYELHLAVQTRDVRWTNGIDRTTLGPEVPTVITTCNLVPAGSHRGMPSSPSSLPPRRQPMTSTTSSGIRAIPCAIRRPPAIG